MKMSHVLSALRGKVNKWTNEFAKSGEVDCNPLTHQERNELDRSLYRSSMYTMVISLLFASQNVFAEADGASLWSQLQLIFFGPWGLLVGAVMLAIAVFGFMRNGFGWSVLIVGLAAFVFVIPPFTQGLQNFGKSLTTSSTGI